MKTLKVFAIPIEQIPGLDTEASDFASVAFRWLVENKHVPSDSVMRGASLHVITDMVAVKVSHPSFPEVPNCSEIVLYKFVEGHFRKTTRYS